MTAQNLMTAQLSAQKAEMSAESSAQDAQLKVYGELIEAKDAKHSEFKGNISQVMFGIKEQCADLGQTLSSVNAQHSVLGEGAEGTGKCREDTNQWCLKPKSKEWCEFPSWASWMQVRTSFAPSILTLG